LIFSGDEKRKMCLEQLGASEFVDFATSKDVVADVKQATEDGQGPHAVILVAVNEKPFQQAAQVCETCQLFAFEIVGNRPPQYVRPRGTVVCVGLPANAFLKAPVFETVIRMITIKGSYVGNRKDTAEALDFYKRGLIKAPFK
jgi:propanol-preferring alcohol dehydrogenase